MSGAPGGTPATYNTIRKGIKATTSKLMSAASVKGPKIPPAPPPPLERSGSERSDAGRFLEGVSFKGKLIGVLEVTEARGDRMCQEALAELKTAVRAAGEHKQRITITVAMDGIRLRDERTADCLYHHPVHKISFIAQDMTDTRAFGYICGSPDAGHKFFGIKTEKTAGQVVIAMRDLFQVVFEMKKKEIEKAKAQLKEGKDSADFKDSCYGGMFGANGDSGIVSSSLTLGAGGPIADLLDLQSELSSLQRGLSEITKRAQASTQKPPSTSVEEDGDPFGDTFRPDAAEGGSTSSKSFTATVPTALAPPPASVRSRHDHSRGQEKKSSEFAKFPVDFKNLNQGSLTRENSDRYLALQSARSDTQYEESSEYAEGGRFSERNEVFDAQWSMAKSNASDDMDEPTFGLFTDLDPLGTGKTKPFVDKKDFFHEIRKASTRKVLRDMNETDSPMSISLRTQPGTIPAEVSALVASTSVYSSSIPPPSRHPTSKPHQAASFSDSFSSGHNASFGEDPRGRSVSRERVDGSVGFANFNLFSDSPRSQRSDFSGSNFEENANSLSGGSLTVALPPLSFRDSPPPFSPPPLPRSPSRSVSDSSSPQLSRRQVSPLVQNRFLKQLTVSTSSVSPRTLPRGHKFARQLSCDDWESTQPNGLSEMGHYVPTMGSISPRPRPRSSLSKLNSSTLPFKTRRGRCNDVVATSSPKFENDYFHLSKSQFDEAPIPPPRPAPVQPPPLPPKRLPSHITFKPPRPPPTGDPQYVYINEYDSSPDHQATISPPIPIPARKPKYIEGSTFPRRVSSKVSESESVVFNFPTATKSPVKDTPSRSERCSVSSKCSTPGRSHSRTGPIDLTNTSLDQLASNLNIPIEKLAKMTVVELAACLAQQQITRDSDDQPEEEAYFHKPLDCPSKERLEDWSEQKFAFDEDCVFAKFQTDFPKSPVETPGFDATSEETKMPLAAPVSEERYAVFKELSLTNKHKSVFDENFLTPQNSMEDEASEVSSGTFKVNFNEDLYPDSIDRKSSISDEVELAEIDRNKNWETNSERIDHECVTVFRSPDISEYENFEPNFECKFEDDFSATSLSERSITPVNSSAQFTAPFNNQPDSFANTFSQSSAALHKQAKFLHSGTASSKSVVVRSRTLSGTSDNRNTPFDDNFSEFNIGNNSFHDSGSIDISRNENVRRSKRNELLRERAKRSRKKNSLHARKSSDKSISPFDDDFTHRADKYEVLRDLETDKDASFEGEVFTTSHQDMLSPFEGSWHRPRSDDQKSLASKNSAEDDARQSPFDRISTGSRKLSDDQDRLSRLSSDLRSSISEPMTPLGIRARVCSRISVGSEDSCDVRSSPFDDSFSSQPSRPHDDKKRRGNEASGFADFENAFHPETIGAPQEKNDQEELFPEVETDFKVSVKYVRESEPAGGRGFFRRDSDPFADDFFAEEDAAQEGEAGGQFWQDDFNKFKFSKDV